MNLAIYNSVVQTLENLSPNGIRVISNDKEDSFDKIRPCSTVSVQILQTTPRTIYYSDNTVLVEIDYYGKSEEDVAETVAKLNQAFLLTLNVGDQVLLISDKSTVYFYKNILTFSFYLKFRTGITEETRNEMLNDNLSNDEDYRLMKDIKIRKD